MVCSLQLNGIHTNTNWIVYITCHFQLPENYFFKSVLVTNTNWCILASWFQFELILAGFYSDPIEYESWIFPVSCVAQIDWFLSLNINLDLLWSLRG